MSKSITITNEDIERLVEDFRKTLETAKLSDGKISFTKTIGNVDAKAQLYFSDTAWQKMQTLVREFDKEVAWHGVAHRGEDETKNEYYITDILVYPQEVTGATVTTDQEEYQTWLYSHDDEVFNNIRMQGHSHVNMGVTPSSVDNSLYERILDQLDDTMFYIFLIWNKRGDKTIKIYDMAKNILFDTKDVEVIYNDIYRDFINDAKNLVKTKAVASSYKGFGSSSYTPAKTESKASEDSTKSYKYQKKKKKSNNAYDFSGLYKDYYDYWG